MEWEQKSTGLLWLASSYRTCHSSCMGDLSPPPAACTHQVEVGEDAGGPVLLGHEQQHLVVNKVTVLLKRASQTQLQGLADLWAWCKGREFRSLYL